MPVCGNLRAAGVVVWKEQAFHSDEGATAAVFTNTRWVDPVRFFTIQGKEVRFDPTKIYHFVEVPSAFPDEVTTPQQIADVRTQLKAIEDFGKKYRKAQPMLASTCESLKAFIAKLDSGAIRFQGAWMDRAGYEKKQKELTAKKAQRKKEAEAERLAQIKREEAVAKQAKETAAREAISQSKPKLDRVRHDYYMKGYLASDPKQFEARLRERFGINEGSEEGERAKGYMMRGVSARLAGNAPEFELDNNINVVRQTAAQLNDEEAKMRLRKEQSVANLANLDFTLEAKSAKIMKEVAESLELFGSTAASFATDSVAFSIQTRAALAAKGLTVSDAEAAKITLASAFLSVNSASIQEMDSLQYGLAVVALAHGGDRQELKSFNLTLFWTNPQLGWALEHADIIKNTDMLSGVAHLLVRGGGSLEEKFTKFLGSKEGKMWATSYRLGQVSADAIARDLSESARRIGGTPDNAMNIMVGIGMRIGAGNFELPSGQVPAIGSDLDTSR